jgi:hypothetical protein
MMHISCLFGFGWGVRGFQGLRPVADTVNYSLGPFHPLSLISCC